MSVMTDPMDALVKLQEALDSGIPLQQQRCDLNPDLRLIADEPTPGCIRMTYAKIEGRKVIAISVFASTQPIDGITCFQAGNAVIESRRNQGLGSAMLEKGIAEMRKGFMRCGAKQFYVEGVVSVDNEPSNKIAKRLLSDTPTAITDEFCGQPALQYVKLIE
jgi:hypothetical protein